MGGGENVFWITMKGALLRSSLLCRLGQRFEAILNIFRDSFQALAGGLRSAADLLDAGPENKRFVAEVEDDGSATLRFGDSRYGLAPAQDTVFNASYRVGNGTAGNIGANALALVATSASSNPALLSPER